MERVNFEGEIVRDHKTNAIVGHIEPSPDMCIDVILNNGTHQYAYYGTIIDDEFIIFCQTTIGCGIRCFGGKNCRYDQMAIKNAGYYVDTKATKSVY